MLPSFSIIIPIFNREWCLERAVNSAIKSIRYTKNPVEIILVNDGSTDDSKMVCNDILLNYISDNNIKIQYIEHKKNLGVCAAKNTGAKNAKHDWLIFLDSDDEMVYSAVTNIANHVVLYSECPLHFFASATEIFNINNEVNSSKKIFLKSYLNRSNGFEAMPVISKKSFIQNLYDEDINGYESLAYARIITKHSYCMQHTVVTRIYHTGHVDRLSSKTGMLKRNRSLFLGHKRFLIENFHNFNLYGLTIHILRILKCKIKIVYSEIFN